MTPSKHKAKPLITCIEDFKQDFKRRRGIDLDAQKPAQAEDAVRDQVLLQLKRREELWQERCPKLYHETVLSKLPCAKAAIEAVLAHSMHGSTGLILHGVPRTGKTRLAYHKLHDLYMEGVTMRLFDAVGFAAAVVSAYREGTEEKFYVEHARVGVLFVDDIGKAKITPRVAEALFCLVDRRLARGVPCLFTTNLAGKALAERFEDKVLYEALHARWTECYEIVHVK